MDCRQVDRCLEANLDGRLSGFERMALRQHLRTCRSCRAKVEAMSAFSANMAESFAAADGPAWERLTPPLLPTGLQEPGAARLAAPMPAVAKLPRRGRVPWRSVAVISASALVLLTSQLLWQTSRPVPAAGSASLAVPIAPTAPALVAEATRRAADRPADFATDLWSVGRQWLAERGVEGLPDFGTVPGLELEGVFLEHVAGRRAAGIAFGSEQGPFTLYLLPPAAGVAPAMGWSESGGLMAMAGIWDGWQAIVVGSAGQLFPPSLTDRLRGVAVAF